MVEMRRRLRDEAQVVIIGGGIVACSVTEEIDGIPQNLPTVRDKDSLMYYKEEVGGLIMGGYDIGVYGEMIQATRHERSLYDPERKKFLM